MKMVIEKKQKNKNAFILDWRYFNSARQGLKYILTLEKASARKILIPAYIGYSPKEGSGVFDPIRATKTGYAFYKMDRALNIDSADLLCKIRENKNNILLLIHYFGFKDRNIDKIKKFARRYQMLIIEDFAHAFYTFWRDPTIDFDYAIFSIHKLFPMPAGGMLLSKKPLKTKSTARYNLFNFNMNAIIQRRIENYNFILGNLKKYAPACGITMLRKEIQDNVPQTFPILLENAKIRDFLYFRLNERGFGVVSLYNRLIKELPSSFLPEHELAGRILNLPVHQDAQKKDLDSMLMSMLSIINKGAGAGKR